METMKPGDIILIEQQTFGPDNKYVPVEWIPSVWPAIKDATDAGYIVIEAAGNGDSDLDDPIYNGAFSPTGRDSGAIIVGAGVGCDNGYRLNRISFSNYGSTVDVQAHGSCVATTGGTSTYLSGTNSRNYYTQYFSGTSSATAIVASGAAVLSKSFQTMVGRAPTSQEVRDLMVATGTPQDTRIAGSIGPQPNITKLFCRWTTKRREQCATLACD